MVEPRCPKCKSRELLWVQRVYEYHWMDSLPDKDGFVDLVCLDDSIVDDEMEPYLLCDSCDVRFDLNLKEKRGVE
jgi:hypothetical protein